MRQISSNEITGIKMDGIAQKDGREGRRKMGEHLLLFC